MRLSAISKGLQNNLLKVWLLVALVSGLAFIFIITPLFANDEIVHFPRAYHVQEGYFWAENLGDSNYGGYLPEQIKQMNDAYREQVQSKNVDATKLEQIRAQYSHERLSSGKKEPVAFTSATLSAGWDYLPPAIGIKLARIMNLPLNWYVYFGRIFSLITYITLAYFAIKYMPIGKRFLIVISLLPTSLVQAGTIGMDGLVNGLSWLIIALTFAILLRKLTVTPKLLAVIVFLAFYLSTTKQGYVPLAALPLILPARVFPFDLKRVWIWRLCFGALLLLTSLWYLGATSPIAEVIHKVQRPGLYVNEADQLHYIFQYPLQFLAIIFVQPFTLWAASTYAGIVGVLTNRLVYLPLAIIALLYALLGITCFHKEKEHVSGRDRLYVLISSTGVFLATFILINLALYLSFTRVGFDRVEGLQGRYFLPLLPLLGIILHTAMPRLFLKIPDKYMDILVYPSLVLSLITAAIVL